MTPYLRPAFAVIALVASLGVASAMDNATEKSGATMDSQPSAKSSSSMNSTSPSMNSNSSLHNSTTGSGSARDMLNLSSDQQKTVWRDIGPSLGGQKTPDGFTASIGARVPLSVQTHPLPENVTAEVPSLKPYHYAKLDDKLLIVNPSDQTVVQIITQ